MNRSGPANGVRRRTHLIVWTAHRILGLGFGALLLLASLTGGLLVLHHELENILERDRRILPQAATDGPAGPFGAHASATAPDARPHRLEARDLLSRVAPLAPPGYRAFRLMPGAMPHAADQIMFVSPDGRSRWSAFVNPYTGDVLWHGADQALFTPWLLGLHMHLHAGGWGYVATGLAGVGLALLGATGLYLHRGRLRGWWRAPLRLNRGPRVAFSDLHTSLGVVSLYFSLVLGVTGAIYAAKIAPDQIAAPKPLAPPFDVTRLAALEPLLAQTRARFPSGEIRRIGFPATATTPLTILVLERDAPVWRKFSRIEFDPVTGAVRAIRDARDATPREKFAAMLAPLHMGLHGSALVKWLYAIGGFAPAVLAASGTTIWWLRTRRARQPAPLAEVSPSASNSPGFQPS